MRPQGQAKAGFYPTPPRVTGIIASRLQTETGKTYRFLDPCAGEGTGLNQLSDLFEGFGKPIIETYGIELDADRAAKARKTLTRCISGDFFTTRTTPGAYSLILLNPPYDSSGDEDRRLEHKFLTACKDLLTLDGILVLIIPQVRLIKLTARHLAAWYKNIKVFRFPDPEYKAYGQIVVIAQRKGDKFPNEATQAELERVPEMFETLKTFDEVSSLKVFRNVETPDYVIPPAPIVKDFYFRGYEIDPADALEQIQQSGLWNDKHRLDEIFAPSEPPMVRPLMPLKKGHLALLIASGFINNQILDDGTMKLIIKGRSFKSSITTQEIKEEETEDGKKKEITETVEKEKFETCINAFNLNNGDFISIR
jgi:hypothetical protein